MKTCPVCIKEKELHEFKSNTRACKECNKKPCPVCGVIYSPTGQKMFCSNKCKILGNIIKNENGCWEWKNPDKHGYGWTKDYVTKRNVLAHRMSYKIFKGEIQESCVICHSCDNPKCVNPDHLWKGNRKENSQDSWKKGRGFKVSYNSQGILNGNAKINENDVKEIRRLGSIGKFNSEIAEIYGLRKQTVGQIIRRKIWRHIE